MASRKTSNTRNALFDNSHVVTPATDLYRGDCLAILPGLAGPFDAVVTDPPYSSGGQSKGDRARSTGDKYLNTGASKFPDFLGDTKDQRSYLHWSALWMSLCFERLTEGGLMIVFSDWRQLPVTTDAMQAAGVTWRGIAVWDKTGGARPYKGGFRSQAEYIVWGSKGPLQGERYSPGVFKVNPQAGGKLHQVGKPLPLMTELVAACGPRILDPFMGSATTGLAAKMQGKHFTGIEASRHYFEVALQRLRKPPE
jgi:site-specific DNA-methyltransferase (adenine-specific)